MTESKRYERYQAWCQLLGVPAADLTVWRLSPSMTNQAIVRLFFDFFHVGKAGPT